MPVTELLIVIYPSRKAWSFSTSISVEMSPVVAGIWQVCLSRPVLLFILTHPRRQRACHHGLTLHTALNIQHVSRSCQPNSPRRKTTASFFSFSSTDRQECQSCLLTQCMRQGLGLGTWQYWLCLPVATVTDVLFNTGAGSSFGWSENKLAHCLLTEECTANVATKYFTCRLISLHLG